MLSWLQPIANSCCGHPFSFQLRSILGWSGAREQPCSLRLGRYCPPSTQKEALLTWPLPDITAARGCSPQRPSEQDHLLAKFPEPLTEVGWALVLQSTAQPTSRQNRPRQLETSSHVLLLSVGQLGARTQCKSWPRGIPPPRECPKKSHLLESTPRGSEPSGDSKMQPGEEPLTHSCEVYLLLFSRSVMSDSLQPMDCSTSGFPVLLHLPELAQSHIHWCDAIQPSHPLSPPSPPAFNLSQHQGLFQWVSSSQQVAQVLELQLQHQSFQWTFRVDFL